MTTNPDFRSRIINLDALKPDFDQGDSLQVTAVICRMMASLSAAIERKKGTEAFESSGQFLDRVDDGLGLVEIPKKVSVRVIAAAPGITDPITQAFFLLIDRFYAECADLPLRPLEFVRDEHYGLALVGSETATGIPLFVHVLLNDVRTVDGVEVAVWEHELRQALKDIPQELWDFSTPPSVRIFPAHTQAQATACMGAEVQLSASSSLRETSPATNLTGRIIGSVYVDRNSDHLVTTSIPGLEGRWLPALNFDLLTWADDEMAPQTKYTCLPLEPVVAARDPELMAAFEQAQLRDAITADQADAMRRVLRRRMMSNEQVAEARGIDLLKLNQLIASTLSTGKVDELQSMTAGAGDPLLEATHQHKKGGLYKYVGTIDFKLTFGEQTFTSKQAVYWHLWPFAKALRHRPAEEFNDPLRFCQLAEFAPE